MLNTRAMKVLRAIMRFPLAFRFPRPKDLMEQAAHQERFAQGTHYIQVSAYTVACRASVG
jgi:hypothetical protein